MRLRPRHAVRAFTLIEIMVVVGLLGLVMSIGIPAIYSRVRKESLTSTVSDVVSICLEARAQAIMRGTMVELQIHPADGRMNVVIPPPPVERGPLSQFEQFAQGGRTGAPRPAAAVNPVGSASGESNPRDPSAMIGAHQTGTGANGHLSPSVRIEMLDVNFQEYKNSEVARVRFYANGTSDEFTMVLQGDNGEWRKISLELVTGLPDVGPFP